MMLRLLAFLLVIPASALADAPPAPLPSVSLPPELQRVLTDYESAWQAHDAARLSSLFAEDGFVLTGGHPAVRGREAIKLQYANSGGPLSLRALAFEKNGAIGYIIGGYSRGAGQPDVGKFTLILRKGTGGRWLIVSDMDNGNGNAPSHPAAAPAPETTPSP